VAWWADFAGRRHCRVVGRRGQFGREQLSDLLNAGRRPLLRVVYPGSCFFRRVGGRGEWLTLCACGSLAPAEKAGWMGPCCGPCHDSREEGVPLAAIWPAPDAGTWAVPQVAYLDFAPDGKTLLTAWDGPGSGLAVWDCGTGQRLHRLRTEGWLDCRGACFHPEGRSVLAANAYGSVLWFDLSSDAPPAVLPVGGYTREFALSPDGALVALADWPGASVWELATGRLLRRLGSGADLFMSLAFSPDGRLLAVGDGHSMTVRVWEVSTGQEQVPTGYGGRPFLGALAFSPRGGLLAAAGPSPRWGGGTVPEVLVRDVARGTERIHLAGHRRGTACLAWAPDGTVLVTGGDDAAVKAWDVASGRELLTLEWHEAPLRALTFSPDGRLLATAGADGAVKLWPAEVLRP
jgi:WD40 repeat protein